MFKKHFHDIFEKLNETDNFGLHFDYTTSLFINFFATQRKLQVQEAIVLTIIIDITVIKQTRWPSG